PGATQRGYGVSPFVFRFRRRDGEKEAVLARALGSFDRKKWKVESRKAGLEEKADKTSDRGAENAGGKKHQHERRPRVQRPTPGVVGIGENGRVVFAAQRHCGNQDAAGEHEGADFARPGTEHLSHAIDRERREGVDELVAAAARGFRGLTQPMRMSEL